MLTWPRVAIVVATHDGWGYLERCLTALQSLDYPADRYQVLVVDNASRDGTAALVAAHFPSVRRIYSPRNLGFAAANNLGFREGWADFFATLNNDTAVSPDWLSELVRPALEDPTIGLVTGKLLLMRDRLRVRLRCPEARSGVLDLPTGAWLDGVAVAAERLGPPNPTYLEFGVPVEPGSRPRHLRLALAAGAGAEVEIALGDDLMRPDRISSNGELELAIAASVATRPVVQNAGSLVFRDGRGRDRGAVAGRGYHYFADDRGQFDRAEEVFAGCGASLLLRSSLLADIGGFDERFFAYYEDIDLSWRARLRGWRVVYAPSAVVRHVHQGTSGAWSGRFEFFTERNRLMMLVKLAAPEVVLAQIARSLAAAGLSGASLPGPRFAALGDLARQLPGLLASRARIQVSRCVGPAEIDRWWAEE
jgi:GT2 family glycosyltransferase